MNMKPTIVMKFENSFGLLFTRLEISFHHRPNEISQTDPIDILTSIFCFLLHEKISETFSEIF